MTTFDIPRPPRPRRPRQHELRAVLAILTTLAGGLAILGLAFALVAGVSPGMAVGAWAGLVAAAGLSATTRWWRADAPGHRDDRTERARRGF
jgi:hypothetical protein